MGKDRPSAAVAEAAHQIFPGEPLRAAILARSIHALAEVTERLDSNEIQRIPASGSEQATLVSTLSQPSAVGYFSAADPLTPARLRGLEARDALLAAEGGVLRAEVIGARLHISRQAVDKRRKAGKLLAVDIGRRGYFYPAWQITDEGALPGLEDIVALLSEHPALAKLRFFLSGNHRLGGERPLDRLRRGDVEAVRRAARTFGEQGAA